MNNRKIVVFYLIFCFVFSFCVYKLFNSSYAISPENWYLDYTYTIDEENHTINLKKYNGEEKEVIVYQKAHINNTDYDVIVSGGTSNSSLFGTNKEIEKITFENGVKAGNTLQNAFYHCTNLKEVIFNDFDTSSVQNMRTMFAGCESLTSLDLSSFDTSNVTEMRQMMSGCSSLKELDISSFDMRSISGIFLNFIHNNVLTKIKIGPHVDFFINSETVINGSAFGRGEWKKLEDGKIYNAVDIAIDTSDPTKDVSGTYVKQSDITKEMNIDYNVKFKINEINDVQFSTTNENTYEFVDNYLYVKNLNVASTDDYVINDKAIFIAKNAVSDSEGNTYDLRITINNVHIYDINVDKGYQDFVARIFHIDKYIDFNSYIYSSIQGSSTIYSDSSIGIDTTFEVIDANGVAQEGDYVFSAYDLDISSSRDSINSGNGHGDYSEGINLIDGFDESTYKVYPKTLLVKNGNRVYGSHTDEATELSEFSIRADSAHNELVWTGQGCATKVMNYYQPDVVKIKKTDKSGAPLLGASLELYHGDSDTPFTSWVSESQPKEIFLMPGKYVIKETNVPIGYKKAEDVTFYVYAGDKVTVEGKELDIVAVKDEYEEYSYTVHYWDKDTHEKIETSKIVNNVEYKTVINSASEKKQITNYIYDSCDHESITIGTNDNVINLYYRRLHGGVVEKHIDEYSNTIMYEKEHDMLVGDNYDIPSREFESYHLVESRLPNNNKGVVTEEPQEVIYYYRRSFNVITKTATEGGTIVGDEGVLEGMDSTVDNIIIEADENYYIEKVTINGEEIEITDKYKLVLDNFKEMIENKEIIVSFKSEIINNVPKTDYNRTFIIPAILSFIGGVTLLVMGRKKKRKVLIYND